MPVLESWLSHRLLVWASSARSVRSRLSGPCWSPERSSLLFGHGTAAAYYLGGIGGVCIDPLELSASVHDVKIAVLGAVPPCHSSVAGRIHRIGTINDVLVILCKLSPDQVRVKGAGRRRERDETDGTERDDVGAIAGGPAFAVINVDSLHAARAK